MNAARRAAAEAAFSSGEESSAPTIPIRVRAASTAALPIFFEMCNWNSDPLGGLLVAVEDGEAVG